jgi:tyrosinase
MPTAARSRKATNGKADVNGTSKREIEQLRDLSLPSLADSMTFARMMEANIRELPKNLRWLFPPVCDRKDQATLTDTEKERYLCAFQMINSDGSLGKLVDTHAQVYGQHTNIRLLPWHRIFLYLFEELLHNYHPDVCIPYWDWTNPGEQHFPDWLVGVTPTVITPTRTIACTRSPGTDAQLTMTVSGVPAAMAQTTYDSFSAPINWAHGGVHGWVGGTMSDPATSPVDPVFYMHHANLDRLWWVWYNSPAGNHQNPNLTGVAAKMAPWMYNEPDTRDIASFGYKYV